MKANECRHQPREKKLATTTLPFHQPFQQQAHSCFKFRFHLEICCQTTFIVQWVLHLNLPVFPTVWEVCANNATCPSQTAQTDLQWLDPLQCLSKTKEWPLQHGNPKLSPKTIHYANVQAPIVEFPAKEQLINKKCCPRSFGNSLSLRRR